MRVPHQMPSSVAGISEPARIFRVDGQARRFARLAHVKNMRLTIVEIATNRQAFTVVCRRSCSAWPLVSFLAASGFAFRWQCRPGCSGALARSIRCDREPRRRAVACTVVMAGSDTALHEFANGLRAGNGCFAQLGDALLLMIGLGGRSDTCASTWPFHASRQPDQLFEQLLIQMPQCFPSGR